MTVLAFPANIIDALTPILKGLDGVNTVVNRELTPTDASGTVGIWTAFWNPRDWEIGSPEPFGRYNVFISTLVKHSDMQIGNQQSSVLVKSIRVMLYDRGTVQLALRQLSETSLDVTERVTRAGVLRQHFVDGSVSGQHAFGSVTQIYVDTEIAV